MPAFEVHFADSSTLKSQYIEIQKSILIMAENSIEAITLASGKEEIRKFYRRYDGELVASAHPYIPD